MYVYMFIYISGHKKKRPAFPPGVFFNVKVFYEYMKYIYIIYDSLAVGYLIPRLRPANFISFQAVGCLPVPEGITGIAAH